MPRNSIKIWFNNLITNELRNISAAVFMLGTVLKHILSLIIFCTDMFVHEVKGFMHGRTGQYHFFKSSNPVLEHFRESKALCDNRRKARVRTLKQHQDVSVLHALYLSHFKLVLISSQVSLQLLWWQLTLSWKMSKGRDSAPGTRHDLHAESGRWGSLLKLTSGWVWLWQTFTCVSLQGRRSADLPKLRISCWTCQDGHRKKIIP